MYTIGSCYLRQSQEQEMINCKLYYNIQLKISTAFKRTFYFKEKTDLDQWYSRLEKAAGIRSLFTHFTVGAAIGMGQFGKVYLAHCKQVQRSVMTAPYHKVLPGKKVAVKVIHKKNDSKLLLETQINEIEVLRVCNHKNVVRIFDAFEDDQKIYIVMEYIDGVDLIHFIKRKKKLSDDEM